MNNEIVWNIISLISIVCFLLFFEKFFKSKPHKTKWILFLKILCAIVFLTYAADLAYYGWLLKDLNYPSMINDFIFIILSALYFFRLKNLKTTDAKK